MGSAFTESVVEDAALAWRENLGWMIEHGPDIVPGELAADRRDYGKDHGSVTNRECRELLGLGDSPSAQVEASRYLKKWSAGSGFLKAEGSPPRAKYRPSSPLSDVLNKLQGP